MLHERKKKIAIVHGSLVMGGAEKVLLTMLEYIDYSKYEVTLWIKDDSGELRQRVDKRVKIKYWGNLFESNCNYKNILKEHIKNKKYIKLVRSIISRILSKLFLHDWFRNLKYYLISMKRYGEEKYDVVISYQSLSLEQLMVCLYYLCGRKKIGWIHGETTVNLNDKLYEYYFSAYKKMNYIFCVSEAVKKSFLNAYLLSERRIKVMYNLQNFQEIVTRSQETIEIEIKPLTFVTVGRLSKEKGQDMIPDVAALLVNKGYDFVWYVVGDGEMRTTIEEKLKKIKMDTRVILLGNRNNPYPYMKQCSIYVQPSYTEGFRTTTFEAKILNKTIVVTDVPGMREQFHDNEAFFCEPTVDSLVQAIETAIKFNPTTKLETGLFSDDYNYKELQKLYDVMN